MVFINLPEKLLSQMPYPYRPYNPDLRNCTEMIVGDRLKVFEGFDWGVGQIFDHRLNIEDLYSRPPFLDREWKSIQFLNNRVLAMKNKKSDFSLYCSRTQQEIYSHSSDNLLHCDYLINLAVEKLDKVMLSVSEEEIEQLIIHSQQGYLGIPLKYNGVRANYLINQKITEYLHRLCKGEMIELLEEMVQTHSKEKQLQESVKSGMKELSRFLFQQLIDQEENKRRKND